MKSNYFQFCLPSDYNESYHINIKETKTGTVLNFLSFIPLLLVTAIAFIVVLFTGGFNDKREISIKIISLVVWIVAFLVYLILHELMHGAVYKFLTGQKLKFSISFNSVFCGVPDIFVYRKTAIIALIAPFILFTAVLLALTIGLYFVDGIMCLLSALLLGVHIGSSIGDLYVAAILIFKFKNSELLIRDTGREYYFYER